MKDGDNTLGDKLIGTVRVAAPLWTEGEPCPMILYAACFRHDQLTGCTPVAIASSLLACSRARLLSEVAASCLLHGAHCVELL